MLYNLNHSHALENKVNSWKPKNFLGRNCGFKCNQNLNDENISGARASRSIGKRQKDQTESDWYRKIPYENGKHTFNRMYMLIL